MKKFYNLIITFTKDMSEMADEVSHLAISEFKALGCSYYDLEESLLDENFGDETLCGGNPDQDLIKRIDEFGMSNELKLEISFSSEIERNDFFEAIRESGLNVQFVDVEDTDWNEEWRKSFKPINVGKYQIIPSWQEYSDSNLELKIYPGMGFGTGTHETTYLCLEAFLKLVNPKDGAESVLDFGAGSGILGLFCEKFFKSNVEYVDIDEDAKTNAIQNFELNFDTGKIDYKLRDNFKVKKTYRVVFANILLEALKLEKKILIESMAPNSILITSGILNNQVEDLINSFGLETIYQSSKNDWSCVVFKK